MAAAPAPDKLTPDDPRVEHHTVQLRGNNWHYLLAKPADAAPTATIVLVHGWPDLAFGWRYQVPYLVSLGLRVIVPDMLGYGRTDAPEAAEEYSMKKIAGDIRALVAHVAGPEERVILGGQYALPSRPDPQSLSLLPVWVLCAFDADNVINKT